MLRSTAYLAVAAWLLLAGMGWGQSASPAPKPPYSPARRAGNTLYISGQIPRTLDGKEVRTSIEEETRQVMENIGRILRENGYTFDDVVMCTVFLRDIQDYQKMNQVYASFFQGAFPARACVGGVEIVFDFRVEIVCTAYREDGHTGKASSSQGGSSAVRVVTDADNGGKAGLALGDTLLIKLVSQPGTGYGWQIARQDTSRLRLVSEEQVEGKGTELGRPEYQVFRLVAGGVGASVIELHYVRPWEKGVPPLKTFSLRIEGP